jgi:hypothetical protein
MAVVGMSSTIRAVCGADNDHCAAAGAVIGRRKIQVSPCIELCASQERINPSLPLRGSPAALGLFALPWRLSELGMIPRARKS